MAKYLFLDANIFLDFYRFGKDDLSEIQKLVVLVQDGEIRLLVNEQLKHEVFRMREAEIAKSFSEFSAAKLGLRAPNYCEGFKEYGDLKEALKGATQAHKKLVEAVREKVDQKSLDADVLIENLMHAATVIEQNSFILEQARQRADLGNPPGKQGSIGDAIHWESLLETQFNRIDIVSSDGDFESELNAGKLKGFLQEEWKEKKDGYVSIVTLFKSLSAYFKGRFPKVELSAEFEKLEVISQLENSGSFATTHAVISELSKFSYFTSAQRERLFKALVNNSQVAMIAQDQDVFDFYTKFKSDAWLLDDSLHGDIALLLGVDEDDFFLPF